FGLDEVLPAGAVERALRRILTERIAPLHHPEPHGAMEDRAVVAAVRRELHEIRGLIRRRLRQQVDGERALARLDDGLLGCRLRIEQRETSDEQRRERHY